MASSLVSVYLVVSAGVGAVLLIAPHGEPSTGSTPDPHPSYVYEQAKPDGSTPPTQATAPTVNRADGVVPGTAPATTTTAPAQKPPAYQRVTGPAGLSTTIPTGWQPRHSTGPGAMQATDPTDPTQFVRYGGAHASSAAMMPAHAQYQSKFAEGKQNFKTVQLRPTTYHGVAALEWEFEHDVDGGRRHVRSLYWQVNGTEYFLYAASSVADWPQMESVYAVMVANTTP